MKKRIPNGWQIISRRGWSRIGRKDWHVPHFWGSASKTAIFLILISILWVSLLDAAKGNGKRSFLSQSSASSGSKEPIHHLPPISAEELPRLERILEGKYMEDRGPYRFLYTVDPVLQMSIQELFQNTHPPFSAFVALEPKTGKVLALADYARGNPESVGVWQRATYPAASVFKLITAAGALEKGVLHYDSPVSYRGNFYRLAPEKLIPKNNKKERQTNFDEALGKSNNVVFGRVASKLLGAQTLRDFCQGFGFNTPILFDFPLEMSKAFVPEAAYDLARCGAGFGEVTLNPLHAAMIAATIANGGVMMRPYVTEEITDLQGEKIYQAKPDILAQPISAKTAADLSRMMLRTVEDGTAAKVFQRYGKNLLRKMSICGKTGSLSGHNPPGMYDWFIGFAPGDDPQIAFAAMIINHNRGRIKGAFVAQEALKTYFREQIN